MSHNRILTITYSANDRYLAAADIDGHTLIWDARTGAPIQHFQPRDQMAVFRLAFSPDERRLAAVDREKTVVYDIATGEVLIIARIDGRRSNDGGFNPDVVWSPDGGQLASSNWDGSIAVWQGFSASATPEQRFQQASARLYNWHLEQAEAAVQERNGLGLAFHQSALDQLRPSDPIAQARLGQVLLAQGRWRDAARTLGAWAQSREPDDGPLHLAHARALLMAGDTPAYQTLASQLAAAQTPFTQRGEWAVHRALLLAANHADLPALLQAVQTSPKSHEARDYRELTLALGHFRAGHWRETLSLLDHAIAAHPADQEVAKPLAAMARWRLDEKALARSLLREAEKTATEPAYKPSAEGFVLPSWWPEFHLLLNEARTIIAATKETTKPEPVQAP